MHPEPRHVVDLLVPHHHPAADMAAAFAPANIALCKYWGKRNEKLKLPLTGSLSVSLGTLGTRMRIEITDRDRLCINGEEQDPEGKAFRRLFEFMDLFRNPGTGFSIESENTIPMGAGLASSASAFAAAVCALDKLYGWNLDLRQQSILARMGSGSASRSLSPGFVEWFAGEREDGMDSYAEALEWVWPGFRVGILTLSRAEKSVSSGAGMRRTMES
ncbi:MAG: diphosphomevalonate decarboxylase, partial [Kiritimatiellia bacterium]